MFIFMFKIEWLFDEKTFLGIFAVNLVVFAISIMLLHNGFGNPRFVAALKMPFFSSIVFFILYRLFKYIYKRNPENTFWMFSKKPIEDVLFSILFWFLGVGLPFFLIENI